MSFKPVSGTIKSQEINNALSNLDSYKADKEAIKNIGDASPKGTFATYTELENTYPNGAEGIYVVTAGGHWYYWDGSAWADGGIYQSTGVAENSVGDKEAIFPLVRTVKSSNLFNKETAEAGYYISYRDGVEEVNSSYSASDWIPVMPSTNFTIRYQDQMAFYDDGKTFISGTGNDGPKTFQTPSNAKYMRVSTLITDLDLQQINEGSTLLEYESYNPKMHGVDLIPESVEPKSIDGYKQTKNLFNKEAATIGKFVHYSTGELDTNPDFFVSEYIPVEPDTEYTRSEQNQAAFYTIEKTFISGVGNDAPNSFITPTDCAYVRVCSYVANLESYQVEQGSVSTSYVPYGFTLGGLLPSDIGAESVNLSLNDAMTAWQTGEKFPIAFYGDSTTDGVNTTGFTPNQLGVDSTNNNAFSKQLENKLRDATNNGVLRVYNAGFSGETADWGAANFDAEFLGASDYNDVKMIGIGFGINDRLIANDVKEYRAEFRKYTEQIINKCYDNGIQPFLITTQAILSPDVASNYVGQYPLRTAMDIETVANEVKFELAKERGLELIDRNRLTELFLVYSQYSAETIIPDRLHFADIGHEYEAGMLFSYFNPQVNWIKEYRQIDYSNQRLAEGIPEDKISMPTNPTDSFKVFANYTKADTTDTLIFKTYLFIDRKRPMSLKAYKSDAASLTYIIVNNVSTTLDSLETYIDDLYMGLYTIEVWSGASDQVDFKGFIIE